MQIPKWAHKYVNEQGADKVKQSIINAELTTSGEIVPVIVRRSSTVGHVAILLLCLLSIVYLALDVSSLQQEVITANWMWAAYIINIMVMVAVASALSRLSIAQRFFTPKNDLFDQVNRRAELEFYESSISSTRDSTGILLFVSLMERRAVILADKAISEKLPKEIWAEVCETLVSGIKSGNMPAAFESAILRCGEILSAEFPIKSDDKNELSNNLVIKE